MLATNTVGWTCCWDAIAEITLAFLLPEMHCNLRESLATPSSASQRCQTLQGPASTEQLIFTWCAQAIKTGINSPRKSEKLNYWYSTLKLS